MPQVQLAHGISSTINLASGDTVQALVSSRAQGPKCLFVHGNPGSCQDWQSLLPLLSETFELAALDLPGFGQSARRDAEQASLSLSRLADVVVATADALGWREPFFLVGHSHGGGVAQVVAAQHPTRVAGLMLLGTLGYPAHLSYRLLGLPGASTVAGAVGRWLQASAVRPLAKLLLRAVLRDIYWPEPAPATKVDSELALFSTRPEVLLSMVQVTLGQPCEKLLAAAAQIRCPVLFMHGELDRLVPVSHARSIHSRIEASGGLSRFMAVAGAGHLLLEFQSTLVARELLQFASMHKSP